MWHALRVRRPCRLPGPSWVKGGPVPRCFGLAALAVLLASFQGCVTERVIHPNSGLPAQASLPSVDPSDLVRFSVRPVGSIRYDGLTLPLFSPDGRLAASQVGRPPGWPGLLAVAGDPRSATCRIAIYNLGGASAEVSEVQPPRGLILGRYADNLGFFVEEPRSDGSRRIGRCDWMTGEVEWLVDEPKVCAAHAIQLRDGTLVYTRRAADESRSELVIRLAGPNLDARAEPVVVSLPDSSLMFPLTTPSQQYVAAVATSRSGLELVTISLVGGKPELLSRSRISLDGGPRAALQAVAPNQAAPPDLKAGEAGGSSAELRHMIPLHAARFDGVVLINASNGQIVRLPERVVAASLWQPRIDAGARGRTSGVLLTRSDLTYLGADSAGKTPQLVSKRPLVCRVTGADRVLALGPVEAPTEQMLSIEEILGEWGGVQAVPAR